MTKQEQKALIEIESTLAGDSLPSFPVTPLRKVDSKHFGDLWIKDESTQATGTHKDRMAWEIITTYHAILKAKKKGLHDEPLPHFSIISAGSAALAIQTQIRKYHLPHLKILVDESTDATTLRGLKDIGCEVYVVSLDEKMLTSADILTLTKNEDGFDITSNRAFDPDIRFYDWMSYEILNADPAYVFIPYGTGQLYENILNIAKRVCVGEEDKTVYTGNREAVSTCHFIGATSNNPHTKAVKLYAPFRPFTQSSPEWIRLFALEGFCGKQSQIVEVTEKNIALGNDEMNRFGIDAEYSGSSALGLLYQMKEQVLADAKIVVVNTGKARL